MTAAARGDAATEIALPEVVGLDATVDIVDRLRAAAPGAAVCLDAAAVEQMSTPFVLTLAAAVAEQGDGGPKLTIRNPTAAFTDAFTDLGLFSELMKLEFAT